MATSWQCPFCGHHATITGNNYEITTFRFDIENSRGPIVFRAVMIACPNPSCLQLSLTYSMHEAQNPTFQPSYRDYEAPGTLLHKWNLIPASRAKPQPTFVPASIVQDYEESCAIETLSPKASATIARRCVQQIIRDFFGVSKPKLYDEIQAIKSKVDPDVWSAIDSLREVGNIGAHAEKDINLIVDVEPDEAAALIRLIEILINETYVQRHRHAADLAEVTRIAAEKKALKGMTATPLPPGGGAP